MYKSAGHTFPSSLKVYASTDSRCARDARRLASPAELGGPAGYILFQFPQDVLTSDALGMGGHHRFNGLHLLLWDGLSHFT